MKMLIGLLSLALSFASIASSGETKTFEYDGTQNSVELMLQGEKTHTEYRIENRPSVCYRTEMMGYRTVCNGGPRGPRNCYQQPVYRQVAYRCIETVRIPYEVKDYDVDAKVLVDVTNLTGVMTPGERFIVTLDGDALTLQTVGSKVFFLVLKKQDVRARMNGSVKMMDALYAVELVEAAPVLAALNVSNLSYKNSVLNFSLGPIAKRSQIGFSLGVVHRRSLGADYSVFDRALAVSEIDLKGTEASTQASVNLEKLGVSLNEKKYGFTARAFYKAEGPVLNKSQFPNDLEDSKTLLVKLR